MVRNRGERKVFKENREKLIRKVRGEKSLRSPSHGVTEDSKYIKKALLMHFWNFMLLSWGAFSFH